MTRLAFPTGPIRHSIASLCIQLEDGAPIDSQSVGPQSGEQEVEVCWRMVVAHSLRAYNLQPQQKRPQEPQQQQPQPEEPQRADMGSGVTDQLDASTAGKQEDDGTPVCVVCVLMGCCCCSDALFVRQTPQPHRPSLIDILLSVNKKGQRAICFVALLLMMYDAALWQPKNQAA